MEFLKETGADDGQIIESLMKLRKRLIRESREDEIRSTPKMVWKTQSACQCLIRRVIDAADSVRMSWNSNNMLATITMARSLFETAAVIRLLRDAVEEAVRTASVENLDTKVMEVLFSARHKFFSEREGAYKAESIAKTVDMMEASLYGENKGKFRDSYGFLSEAVHPNHLGTLGLYTDLDDNGPTVRYGIRKEKRDFLFSQFHLALGMIWLADMSVSDIESFTPELTKISP
jgi:hypothetical protein